MILSIVVLSNFSKFLPESFHSLLRVYSQLNLELLANAFNGTMLRHRVFQDLALGKKAFQQGIKTV